MVILAIHVKVAELKPLLRVPVQAIDGLLLQSHLVTSLAFLTVICVTTLPVCLFALHLAFQIMTPSAEMSEGPASGPLSQTSKPRSTLDRGSDDHHWPLTLKPSQLLFAGRVGGNQ